MARRLDRVIGRPGSHWGYVKGLIREGLDAALLERTGRPGAQWIGDTIDIGVISDADKAWVETDWFPRFSPPRRGTWP